MLAVDKAHHIDVRFYGTGLDKIQDALRSVYPDVQFNDDGLDDIENWDFFQQLKSELTSGVILRNRRENAGFTQEKLAELTGTNKSNISAMELGKRAIGMNTAKKLAEVLHCDVSDFAI